MTSLPSYLVQASNLAKLDKARTLTASATVWKPIPNSPQAEAYQCQADELFYGGAAGGGKSDLLLGLAATAHHKSILFRSVFPSLRDLIERSKEINRDGKYNESTHLWRLRDGQLIEFASIQYEKDAQNYQGRPHDLYGFDEITEFTESQYRFVTAWNRTTRPNQRARVVCTGNPPTNAEGEWIIQYWGAWLDPQHPNPAKPGELRWYMTLDGKDTECPDDSPINIDGEMIRPRSRTFIPAKLQDNPYLRDTGYFAVLNSLPEPLRSKFLFGDFGLSIKDNPWQVIPTQWVLAAQQRWLAVADNVPPHQTAIGVDVAHGGQDKTTLAPLYGVYFGEITSIEGVDTPRGADVVIAVRDVVQNPHVKIGVDAVGYGASATEGLEDAGYDTLSINAGSSPTSPTDKTDKFGYANLRAQLHWQFREALNPEGGEGVCLPPDRELLADLCAARYSLRSGKYWVEPKEDIKARLGRSPDKGEAVLHAWYAAYGYTDPTLHYEQQPAFLTDWRG